MTPFSTQMKTRRVVVVGGGISGLAAAYRLTELSKERNVPLEITLLESKSRLGGIIETEKKDGFLFEGGPDSFVSEKPWAVNLCKRLGLERELIPTQEEFRKSFIVRHDKLVAVPNGFYLMAPTNLGSFFSSQIISWFGKFRMAAEPLIPASPDSSDESVGQFVRRRFGQEALRRIGQPMIGGIYTADPDHLSLNATFPAFKQMEREHGSVVRGLLTKKKNGNGSSGVTSTESASGPRYSLFFSLRNGVGSLIDALTHQLPDMKIQLGTTVEDINYTDSWKVRAARKDHSKIELKADAVCLALPAFGAKKLLARVAPEVSRLLGEIPYESVATVNLAFRRQDITHSLSGFGFVVPQVEGRGIVGCSFSSTKYIGRAIGDGVLLRAFVGGALGADKVNLDDAAMERMVLGDLHDLIGLRGMPMHVSIRRYPQSMPQYGVGHVERVQQMDQKLNSIPSLYLTGNAYRGIGIPDCIHDAEQTAEKIFNGF